jgi:CBS domain-containing protein
MVEAKDIMTTHVISVTRNTPICEAGELLIKHEITGMPVLDDDKLLVGIITEKDLLRLLHTHEAEQDKTVEDFMTAPAIFFQENESLEDICDLMIANNFRRVPVTSASRKRQVIGIISRPDVLKYIIRLRHAETLAPVIIPQKCLAHPPPGRSPALAF